MRRRPLTENQFEKLCTKFDVDSDGGVSCREFLRNIAFMDQLLEMHSPLYSDKYHVRKMTELYEACIKRPFTGYNRIFFACFIWVCTGVTWGVVRMKWDIITATHFAISALATG